MKKRENREVSLSTDKNSIFAKNILFLVILVLLVNFVLAQQYTLKVTEEHLFFVVIQNTINVMQVGNEGEGKSESKVDDNNNLNGVWKTAKELRVGDFLITDDRKKAKVTSVREVDENIEVYNLEALPFNDFIVAGNAVVHNSNKRAFEFPEELEFASLKGDINSNEPGLAKYAVTRGKIARILSGQAESITAQEAIDFYTDFERIFLGNVKGITYNRIELGRIRSPEGDIIFYAYEILGSDSTNIGRIVKSFNELEIRFLIDPHTIVGNYITSKNGILAAVFSPTIFVDVFDFNRLIKHEYKHAFDVAGYKNSANPNPESSSSVSSIIKPTNTYLNALQQIEATYRTDLTGYKGRFPLFHEIKGYLAEFSEVLKMIFANPKNPNRWDFCRNKYYKDINILRLLIKILAEENIRFSQEGVRKINNILGRNINEISLELNGEVIKVFINGEKYFEIMIGKILEQETIQLGINYGNDGTGAIAIKNPEKLRIFKEILANLRNNIRTTDDVNRMLEILRGEALPIFQYMSSYSPDVKIFMISFTKQFDYFRGLFTELENIEKDYKSKKITEAEFQRRTKEVNDKMDKCITDIRSFLLRNYDLVWEQEKCDRIFNVLGIPKYDLSPWHANPDSVPRIGELPGF